MDALDELPCAVLVTDADARVLFANAELLAMTSQTLPTCQNQRLDALFPPAGRIFLQTHVWPTLLREGAMNEVYLQIVDSQGQRTPVMLNARRGQFQGSSAYVWTLFKARQRQAFEAALLNARRAAEDALHHQAESERFTRSVADLVPGVVAFWDHTLCCRFANSAHLAWFGRDPSSLLGTHLRDLVGEDSYQSLLPHLQQALDGTLQVFERTVRKASGEYAHTLAHLVPQLVKGQVSGVLVLLHDISPLKAAESALKLEATERQATLEQLRRSNDELARFAHVASHDLQEPLRMVTSYGQLLQRRHRSALPAEAQEFVDYMLDGGQRAQALIRDLLSLARLDSRPQAAVPVNLAHSLAAARQQLRQRLQDSGALLTHDPLPTVVGDPAQLGQLLAQLLDNALKFSGVGPPRVHLAAQRDGRAWRISMADQGIGIESRYFERIFQMFQRLHLRHQYEGNGIGLAICKKVVERHGGCISVVSAPGQGATFHITLPDPPGAGAHAMEPTHEQVDEPAAAPAPPGALHAVP